MTKYNDNIQSCVNKKYKLENKMPKTIKKKRRIQKLEDEINKCTKKITNVDNIIDIETKKLNLQKKRKYKSTRRAYIRLNI